MIVEAVRRSPLADYARWFADLSAASPGDLFIHERPFLAQVNLRIDPTDAGVMGRLATALGFALPVAPNTIALTDDRRALWLGPDEWLIVGPEDEKETLEQAMRNGFAGAFGSIVDVSASRTVLEIRGAKARDLLSHGTPIDLDARSFGPGGCAQTLLGKAQVIIERRGDEAAFHLYLRSSFAASIADWLLDAAEHSTVKVSR